MSTTDTVDVVLLSLAVPPSLLFVFVYGLLQPWYRSWWGWALWVSATALSALLSVNLGYRLFAWSALARTGWLRTGIYVFIAAGCWLNLIALAVVLVQARRALRRN